MSGLGITREQITDEVLAILPEILEGFGQPIAIDPPELTLTDMKAILIDRTVGGERLGSINRRATHDVVLPFQPNFPKRGGFSITLGGVQFVPAGETDNPGMLNVCLFVPLVERDVFFSDEGTVGGKPIRFRIEALTSPAAAAGRGAADVSVVAGHSHRAYLMPGLHLEQGDVITTSNEDRFMVVDPIQQDYLGDVVGLSRSGTGQYSSGDRW